jgi:hypothetical protein
MPLPPIEPRSLPYLTHPPTDGRSIPALPFLDGGGVWHAYLPQHDGMLIEIRPVEAVRTSYIYRGAPPTTLDVPLPLSQLVVQHFSFPDAFGVLDSIEHDYLNSLASIHKYFILLDHANRYSDLTPTILVSTELEFAFANHRAFYDMLTQLFTTLYGHFVIQDGSGKRVRATAMPDSFGKLLRKPNRDLSEKFHLPTPVIQFLRGKEDHFTRLCRIRDNIMHHGHSADYVFCRPDGFALDVNQKMWADLAAMPIWPTSVLKPNGLGSVLGLLGFLVQDVEDAVVGLVGALLASFSGGLPEAIAEGYSVLLRDHLIVHRWRLPEYLAEQWFDANAVLDWCAAQWTAKGRADA